MQNIIFSVEPGTNQHMLTISSEGFLLTMLAVLLRLPVSETRNEKSSVLLLWFSRTPDDGTQEKRSDNTHRQRAPGVIIQLIEVCAHRERIGYTEPRN